MSKEQEYWFSDMGLWGSNPVETYEFGPEHHSDLYRIFDWVHENEVGDFMAYLQSRPHAYEPDDTSMQLCITCKILVDDFGVM
jgi:hypothetical protein